MLVQPITVQPVAGMETDVGLDLWGIPAQRLVEADGLGESQQRCSHCGCWHQGKCPRIKAIEYYENGVIKRVEYHE